jgi:hypothetical protein
MMTMDDCTVIAYNNMMSTNCSEFADAIHTPNSVDAIADSEAMQIIIIEGTTVINKCCTIKPLKVALTNGHQVLSTHKCDVFIKGLPSVLKHVSPSQ